MTLAQPPAIRVSVNDRQLPVVAIFEDGRVLVPLRAVVEALGGTVSAFHLPLPAPARIIAGRTYASIRVLADAMHAQIQYDARTHLVQVFTASTIATATGQPLPTPQPDQQSLQLNISTTQAYGGESINVELIAPPGGQAFASVCTSTYEFPLYAANGSSSYSGSVSTQSVEDQIDCPITARYIAWNGAVSYAPYPAFLRLIPFASPQQMDEPTPEPTDEPTPEPRHQHPEPRQTPAPEPTPAAPPSRIPLPPEPRATPEPVQRIRALPIERAPEPIERPAPEPIERATPEPRVEPTDAATAAPTDAPTAAPAPEPPARAEAPEFRPKPIPGGTARPSTGSR